MWGYNFDFWEMLKRKSERFWYERGKSLPGVGRSCLSIGDGFNYNYEARLRDFPWSETIRSNFLDIL